MPTAYYVRSYPIDYEFDTHQKATEYCVLMSELCVYKQFFATEKLIIESVDERDEVEDASGTEDASEEIADQSDSIGLSKRQKYYKENKDEVNRNRILS